MDVSFLDQVDSMLYLSVSSIQKMKNYLLGSKEEPKLREGSDLSDYFIDLAEIEALDAAIVTIPSESEAFGFKHVDYSSDSCVCACPNCND